jgi:hypothetical protein
MENLCCARKHSVQFFVLFFNTVKLHSLTKSVWGPYPVSMKIFERKAKSESPTAIATTDWLNKPTLATPRTH